MTKIDPFKTLPNLFFPETKKTEKKEEAKETPKNTAGQFEGPLRPKFPAPGSFRSHAPKTTSDGKATLRNTQDDLARSLRMQMSGVVSANKVSASTTKKVASAPPKPSARETTRGAADRLYKAMKGMGTNETEIMRVLDGRSSEEIDVIKKDFARKTGGESLDSWLKSELGGSDLKKANLLMKGSKIEPAKRDTGMLRAAMEGVGTDEKAIMDTLYGKSPAERKALASEYHKQTGRSLESDLKSELSGSDQELALATLKNGKLGGEDKINAAIKGIGTDEKAIFSALEGKKPEELKEIKANYQKKYGRDLVSDLKGDLSGEDQVKALALLETGKVSDADKLKSAMQGMGTDEKAIEAVFKDKKPEERQAIVAEYNKKYGSLDKALKSELSGNELSEIQTLMNKGDLSAAEKLNRAVRGFGTDEGGVLKALDGLNPQELSAAKKEYQQKYGKSIEQELRSELSGSTKDKALLLAQQGKLTLDQKVHFASKGAGTNEQAIFDALSNATPEERAAFQKSGGMNKLTSEMSGSDLEKAQMLLKDGKLNPQQQVHLAMEGLGTREKDIFKALDGASDADRKAIMNDPKMMSRIRSELSGKDLERTELLLKNGKLDRTEQLHFGMTGAGTDEEMVHKALEGLNPQERLQLQSDYKAKYGTDLMKDLSSELGKRDMWKAEDALIQPPRNLRERMDRAILRSARERDNGSAVSNFSDGAMDLMSNTGKDIDQTIREYKLTVKDAQNGKISMEQADATLGTQEKKLDKLSADYLKEKEAAADTVGSIATMTAAAAAMAATGGLAAIPAAAIIAGSAGATKVASKQLMMGSSYDLMGADGLKDFATGAGDGLAMVAMGGAGDKITSAIGKRALAAQGKNVSSKGLMLMGRQALRETGGTLTKEAVNKAAFGVLKDAGNQYLSKTLTHKLVGNAVVGAVKGAAYSGVSSTVNGIADEKNWDGEFIDGLQTVLSNTGKNMATSAKGWAIGLPAFKLGEHVSQSAMRSISIKMGQRVAAGQNFSQQKLMNAGYKALGDEAKNVSTDILRKVGREQLFLEAGEHYMNSTLQGQASKIFLDNLITRGVSAPPKVFLNSVGNREVWDEGLIGAFETIWDESAFSTFQDTAKFGSKDAAIKLANRLKVAKQGSLSENVLGNIVSRSVATQLD